MVPYVSVQYIAEALSKSIGLDLVRSEWLAGFMCDLDGFDQAE